MTVSPAEPAWFTFHVRIPGWAKDAQLSVNGVILEGAEAGQYYPVARRWNPNDVVMLNLSMSTEIIVSNPRLSENGGRVSVERGPVVYCMEQLDQPSGAALADLSIIVNPDAGKDFQLSYQDTLLGGVVLLRHKGAACEIRAGQQSLYSAVDPTPPKTRPDNLCFVPYHAWANREPSAMQVWVPYLRT